MDAAEQTVHRRSLRTYRRARAALICVGVFWFWLLLGASAFVAGMFDSPGRLFLALYAGAAAVLVSIPVGVLAAVLMMLNRPAAGVHQSAAVRLQSAARAARSAGSTLPWPAAVGHARRMGRQTVSAARTGAAGLRKFGGASGSGRSEARGSAPAGPMDLQQPARRPGGSEGGTRKPAAPRLPPLPPRQPAAQPFPPPLPQGQPRLTEDQVPGPDLRDLAS